MKTLESIKGRRQFCFDESIGLHRSFSRAPLVLGARLLVGAASRRASLAITRENTLKLFQDTSHYILKFCLFAITEYSTLIKNYTCIYVNYFPYNYVLGMQV